MQPKTDILFNKEARQKLLNGVNIMANAVGSTLGPRGQSVAIASSVRGEIYERKVVNDGVSVARAIELQDEFENMGAQLLKEAAQKQVDEVGDGTTVVMVLAQSIIQECMKLVDSGINPMSLRKDLEDTTAELIKDLELMATPIRGIKDLRHIATISANNKELGELVADTIDKFGKDGVVTVESSKSVSTTVEHQEGMQLDKGYLHPWFVTNPERMEAVLENPYILITDKSITSLGEFTKFFDSFTKQSRVLMIISPDISGEALPLLLQNKLQGKLQLLCVQAPSFGEDQKNILQDIAVLTGGKFFSQDAGYSFEDLTIDDLGFAESVSSSKDETIIVGGKGSKADIASRVASIKKSLETADGDFDKERMKARIGKLTNGVAVIRVGGQTEVEMKERRERVLDSVAASRAALEKGIVAGGEVVFLHIRKKLKIDPTIVSKILYKVLYKPFQKLITNADLSEVEMALDLQGKGKDYGVDATDGIVKNMVTSGIIDPVLVSIHALQNAVSVAIQIITTGCVITPIIKEEVKK